MSEEDSVEIKNPPENDSEIIIEEEAVVIVEGEPIEEAVVIVEGEPIEEDDTERGLEQAFLEYETNQNFLEDELNRTFSTGEEKRKKVRDKLINERINRETTDKYGFKILVISFLFFGLIEVYLGGKRGEYSSLLQVTIAVVCLPVFWVSYWYLMGIKPDIAELQKIVRKMDNALKLENQTLYRRASIIWKELGYNIFSKRLKEMHMDKVKTLALKQAQEREKHLDYPKAIELYERLEMPEEAARIRKLKAEQGAVKVAQKVVHGDEISKTEIKDSVLNRSNVGAGRKSKSEELREAKALLDDGIIDDDEFKQMKKEILGK